MNATSTLRCRVKRPRIQISELNYLGLCTTLSHRLNAAHWCLADVNHVLGERDQVIKVFLGIPTFIHVVLIEEQIHLEFYIFFSDSLLRWRTQLRNFVKISMRLLLAKVLTFGNP